CIRTSGRGLGAQPRRISLHRPFLESLLNEQAFVVLALAILEVNDIELNRACLKLEHGSSSTILRKRLYRNVEPFSHV
ncbi:hypothetical protein P7M20_29055, partial [Vibrio parahaemolyticus]|nr:hypothetical protein [Vibrio parahaemolyticus]